MRALDAEASGDKGFLRWQKLLQVPIWEFPKIRGTLFGGSYNKDPTV